jgi:anti-sigma factor RsiW
MSDDLTHPECADRLSSYIDGELPVESALAVSRHLAQCSACAVDYEQLLETRESMQRHLPPLRAPDVLRSRIAASVREERAAMGAATPAIRRSRGTAGRWVTAAACAVLVIGAYAIGVKRASGSPEPNADEVLAIHLRSLQNGHLTDVASTDQHTVKPWFAGKVDFAPDVPRLDSLGFPLIGGRLEYLGRHAAAALVYQRRLHLINVLIDPSDAAPSAPKVTTERGYHLISWNERGMSYWVVSDLAIDELQSFCALFRRA